MIGSTIYIPIDTFSMCCNLWGSGTDTKRGTHNKRDFCRQKIASITNVHQFRLCVRNRNTVLEKKQGYDNRMNIGTPMQ